MPQDYKGSGYSAPKKKSKPKAAPKTTTTSAATTGSETGPVTVYVSPHAQAKGIPVRQSVKFINQQMGKKVLRVTQNKAKADVVVKAQRGGSEWQGNVDYIPRSRNQIENQRNVARVDPSTVKPKNTFQYQGPRKDNQVKPKAYTTTHELLHTLGATHKMSPRERKTNTVTNIMSGGTDFTGFVKREIRKTLRRK